jgi:hypothetical protein
MSTTQRTPASIAGIKRLAKKIASEKSVTHAVALVEAAKLSGYQNFIHAKRALIAQGTLPKREPSRVSNARKIEIHYSDFQIRARTTWAAAINQFASGNHSLAWTGPSDIVRVLEPFMGSNANHAHLPTGGGFDFRSVGFSTESGCLDFEVGTRLFIRAKSKQLRLERIAEDPAESFMLLELNDLDTTGVYDAEQDAGNREYRQEEVVEIGGGNYVRRNGVDDGYYYDRNGAVRDLPENYRQIVRLLNGQIMLVTKGSIWNGAPGTYSGAHDRIFAGDIRGAIEHVIRRRAAA